MTKINRNKSIGKVIFIVEGGKKEFTLLRRIFCSILGYECVEKARQKKNFLVYRSKEQRTSKIAVINTEESNISDICDENCYLDSVFEKLITDFDFPVDNTRIFYLFDRDPESNVDVSLIKRLILQLKNSYENDNGYDRGGLLLLNYPCIESYEVANFIDDTYFMKFGLGKEVKKYVCSQNTVIQHNKISEDSILKACEEMLKYISAENIDFDIDNLDIMNMAIFDKQESLFSHDKVYSLLSLLSTALIDLGIIEIDD